METVPTRTVLRRAPRRGGDTAPYLGQKGRYALAAACLAGLLIAISPLPIRAQESGGQSQEDGQTKQSSKGVYTQRLQSIVKGPNWSEPAHAMLVLSSNPDPKRQANLQEDLAVMRHILDKTADDVRGPNSRNRNALGVDLVFQPEANRLSTAYFEGYGALFLLNVNLPLLPTAASTEDPKEEKRASSEWEEARQEVFGDASEAGAEDARASEPYSEETVNRLKSSLLDGLKNASNIRDLQPDEGVTLCVLGGTRVFRAASRTRGHLLTPRSGETYLIPNGFGKAPGRRTALTIRVKKSDIDAFARGQMNPEEFRKTARIAAYEVEGGGNAWFGTLGTAGYGSTIFGTAK